MPEKDPQAPVRILVVDDDEIARHILEQLMEGAGYIVLIAGDGMEALALIRAQCSRLNLAIIDYDMPGMDGIQFYLELRAIYPSLPAILYTGHPDLASLQLKCPPGLLCKEKDYDPVSLVALVHQRLNTP